MHPFKRGLWTKEEIKKLESLVAKYGKRWAYIQSELKRSSEACRDKYRELGLGFRRGRWLQEESNRLENLVRETAKVVDGVNMAQVAKMIDSKEVSISWYDISNKMGNRSRLSCYKRFQQLAGVKRSIKQSRVKDAQSSSRVSSSNFVAIAEESLVRGELASNATTTVSPISKDSPIRGNNIPEKAATTVVSALTSISMSTPNPIRSDIDSTYSEVNNMDAAKSVMSDEDLVNFIASSSYKITEDVTWESEEVKNRWERLVLNYMENLDKDTAEEVLNRPLWEIAKFMIPTIDEDEQQAEMAARTVEAVLKF